MQIVDINGRERNCERVFLDSEWPGYVSVEFVRKADPTQKRIEWMPIADFAKKNPSLSHLWGDKSTASVKEFSSIVSRAGKKYLMDDTASWTRNLYAGYFVWISRGPGEGQTRTIMENTTNKLVVDKEWDKRPNKDSQYTVVQHLGNTTPQGNVLPIVELRKLEEFARQQDIASGREPAPRQYTVDKK